MPRFVPKAYQRSKILSMRVSVSEHDAIRAAAIQHSMAVPTYLRAVIFGYQVQPIPSAPKVPYKVLKGLDDIYKGIVVAHQRTYSWGERIKDSKYKRVAKEDVYRALDDLAQLLESSLAEAHRTLHEAGIDRIAHPMNEPQ